MPTSSLLSDLNPIQRKAVLSTEGPTLILAGAGSGKTKVLTHRVAYLIGEKHIPPENICVLTFTNKASNEMKGRILKLLCNEQRTTNNSPIMGTFHSFCARILRKEGKFLGLPTSFTIYDENDALDAVKAAMKNLDIAPQKNPPSTVRNTISSAKNEMISSLEYVSFARGYFQETVAKIYLEYQKILDENHAVDFDDLLLLVVKLFQGNPEVLTKYQIQFRYILIDEYQDTNAVQYLLSKLLANRYKNICIVGDASQSIYAFRGADFRNIVNFQRDYPQAKVFNLEQNYRSTQNILDTAYSVISKNRTHPILKLWTQNPTGEKIQITEVKNEAEEALFIAKIIREINLPLSHFAILYRTNAQSRALEEVFLKISLPYVLVGGIRFYERKEIKDMLSYLRLLSHPNDSISLARIEKIGKGRMAKFQNLSVGLSPKLEDYTTLELLDKILEVTDYLDYIDDGTDIGKSRVENVKELRSVAEEQPDLTQFLETVALVESEYSADEKLKKSTFAKALDDKFEAVTLTTLHQAKGLEWPVVFMAGMEEGLFPHSRCLLNPEEMEEERRLCYVGITRAKQKLYLTYTRQRLYFGTRSSNLVSRFIMDIPEELIQSNTNFADQDQFLDDVSQETDTDDWLNT
ncbi:MAG: UvrD-helicase domain-containing protein [Candidatus Daviesbacteria bacterium]